MSLELVHSLLVAKHLGAEKLKSVRHYYDRYRIHSWILFGESLEAFLEQTTDATLHESEIHWIFGNENNVLMFPYRMQMITLWEQDTNWRVLQASAHCDIDESMWFYFGSSLEDKPEAVSLFDYWSNIPQGLLEGHSGPCFLRAVIETVRTFLAQWVTAAAQEAIWEPAMPD